MYDEDEIEDKYIKYNLTIKNNESNEQKISLIILICLMTIYIRV